MGKWLGLLFYPLILFSAELRFSSGFLHYYEGDSTSQNSAQRPEAAQTFIREHFDKADFEWRLITLHRDTTHQHLLYALYYKNRRVLDHFLKLHYNNKGFIEYASNTWESEFSFSLPQETAQNKARVMSLWQSTTRSPLTRWEMDPIIWLNPSGKPVAAFEVKFTNFSPLQFRTLIVDERTGALLDERKVVRNASVSGAKAWTVSPYDATNTKTPDTVTLQDLVSSLTLSNGFLHIRRQENRSSATLVEVNPDPTVDLNLFSPDPNNYQETCTGGSTDCPNQRIDAVNLYYHLNTYRTQLRSYYDSLGAESPTANTDPLEVIVNAFTADVSGEKDPNQEVNNAAFVPRACTIDAAGNSVARCLAFLRPAPIKATVCGGTVSFYDVAREALVLVHEYQHYITDSVTQMVPGSSIGNVGDALHEGYSDYFAVSQISALAGRDVTVVGQYAFQNCTFFERDLSVVREYKNGTEEEDVHVAGLSWASGLWKLRSEFGREVIDRIALKSLYFLSPLPGFYEAVESLVKADTALYGGEYSERIRTLFYDEIKFIGGQSTVFRNSKKAIVEVGFQSCGAVHGGRAGWWFFSLIAWLGITLGSVRWIKK